MKRIILTIVLIGLVVPAVAVASRMATGRTRKALDQAASGQLPSGIPERCLFARVTTKDGGKWAVVGFNSLQYRSCARWGFNGVVILRHARRRWDYVTEGSAITACGRFGIPVAVSRDLHLPCLQTSGSQRSSSEFLSPDRKIWCLLNDAPGVREADCFYDANRLAGGQEYAASLHANGQLTTCAWQPSQGGLYACVQNWDPSAPVLKSGQVDAIYQYRCQAAPTAITCTVDTGPGKGKGFTISATGVTPIP